MTLLNPAGLAALAATVVPIVIHLLLRRRARRIVFPSVRFIQPSSASAIRIRSISDWPLLLIRCAIVTAAALALARPLVVTPLRRDAWNARIARAVVVDVTPSAAVDPASAPVREERETAFRSTVIEASAIDAGIAEGVRWLDEAPPARRELVVVSDFQRGSLDEIALARVPPSIGVRLRQVTRGSAPLPAPLDVAIEVRAPASDRAMVSAALAAAGEERGRSPFYATREKVTAPLSVVFVTRGVEPPSMGPLRAVWMAAAAAAVERHRAGAIDDRTMAIVVDAPASSFELPLAIRAVRVALLAPAAWRELEPETLPAATLAAWSRPAPAIESAGLEHADYDDGRWLWLAAVILLGVEGWLRRRVDRDATRSGEGERARAA